MGSEDWCHTGCIFCVQVDESRAKLRAETAAAQETTQEAASQLAEQEAALAAAKEQQEGFQRQLKSLAKERKDALQAKATVEADVNEAAAALEAGRQGRCMYGCLMLHAASRCLDTANSADCDVGNASMPGKACL